MCKEVVLNIFKENSIDLKFFSVIVGRGGVLLLVKLGVYLVNEEMIDVLRYRLVFEYVFNLGVVVVYVILEFFGINLYIYDFVVVDEFIDVVRIFGFCGMDRLSVGYVLNIRVMVLKYVKDKGKDYKSLNLIVVYIGGGVSIYFYEKGRMVDMLFDDEGLFFLERLGRVFVIKLVVVCYLG